MNLRLILISCILLAACQRAKHESHMPLAKSAEAAMSNPEAAAQKRPVYPYSIIKGGAYTPSELKRAKERDPVVASHYAHINPDALKPLRLTSNSSAYVSYRVGNLVFWTSGKVMLQKGELVLSDGENWVRGRCGNQIAETPQAPVMTPARLEPASATMDRPVAAKYVGESSATLETVPRPESPGPWIHTVQEKPNAPLAQVPSGGPSWNSPVSAASGPLYPVGSGAGGGGGGGGGAGSQVGGGHLPDPFHSTNQSFDVLPPLPPFQSVLMPYPLPDVTPPPGSTPPNLPPTTGSPLTPELQKYQQIPITPVTPTGSPANLPVYWTPPVTVTSVPEMPMPPGLPPPGLSPPDMPPPNQPRSGLPPPGVSPPSLPEIDTLPPAGPPEVSTPEPSTLIVSGISLLLFAGYYFRTRMKSR